MDPNLQAQLIAALVTFITVLVTALTVAIRGFIKDKTSAQQLNILEQLADLVVQGAEQQGTAVNKLAVDKKEYAMTALSIALKDQGIKVDPAVLDAAIEAAVLKGFNYDLGTPDSKPVTTTTIQPEPVAPTA